MEKVLTELGRLFYWKRTNNTKPKTYHKKAKEETFVSLDLTQEVESVVEIDSDPCTEENLIQNQTGTELDQSLDQSTVVFIVPEEDEVEQNVDSISVDGFSIPMESEIIIETEAKKWVEDWPITDHNIFLEIQMKVEEDPELKDLFVSNN